MRKKRSGCMALLLAGMILLLTACGGDTTGTGNTTETDDTGGTAAKDTLVVAVNAGPVDLDPHGTTDQNTYDVRYQIYEGLIYVDAAGDIQPQLATDWEWEDDTTLLLTLRQGVTFQNGSTFDAEDVFYSLERARESSYTSAYIEEVDLEASEITEDGNVRLVLTVPQSAFLSRLDRVMMIDKETWEENGEEAMLKNPVGTGAYMLTNWVSDDRVEFDAYPGYWGGEPYFKHLMFRIIPESASRALEIEAGTVDVSLTVQAADIGVLEANEDISIYTIPSYMITYLGFDCTKAPYDNVKVRQALSYALDRQTICDLVYESLATPADAGRLSEVYWGYAGDELPHYTYDPEKARELLAEAGYADGFDMSLMVSESEQDQIDMSEIIQNQLGEVGIRVTIDVTENATYLDTIVEGGFDAFLCNSTGSSPDPGEATKSFISTRPTWSNTTRYFNDELTALIQQGQQTIDETAKREIFVEVQEIINTECPWVFLVHNSSSFAARSEIQGLNIYPSYAHFFKEAYME